MAEKADFKCLRCEHEYEDKYTRGVHKKDHVLNVEATVFAV